MANCFSLCTLSIILSHIPECKAYLATSSLLAQTYHTIQYHTIFIKHFKTTTADIKWCKLELNNEDTLNINKTH